MKPKAKSPGLYRDASLLRGGLAAGALTPSLWSPAALPG